MRKFLVNKVLYLWLFLCSQWALEAAADIKEDLDALLKQKLAGYSSVETEETSIVFRGNKLVVDGQGILYRENQQGKRYPLNIEYDHARAPKREFIVSDAESPPVAGLMPNPMNTRLATEEQINFFDLAASKRRKRGIATIKYQNSECYYEYAKQRLGINYLERLLAMERLHDPRPLAFETDNDWTDFKNDLRDIFDAFKGMDSYVVILGTSTTFFSENPRKGNNAPLFKGPPECISEANNPVSTKNIYTFDTPSYERSDIDVHILIPELSALCEQASVPGNNGVRTVYYENTMDKCIMLSPQLASWVTSVADKTQSLKKALVPGSKLDQFFKKYESKLGREINFSVLIRPDQRKGPLREPISNFSKESYLKSPFIIEIK